jgi:branched-chain amino acid transport system permease protein
VILLILLSVPMVFGVLTANVLTGFGITALFAVSLNLLAKYGLYSFGHALFFGTGAYASALGLIHMDGLPFLGTLILGGTTAGLLGLILSPVFVRVTGVFFTLLTIALNQIMYVICLKFSEVTGGENGLVGYLVPPMNIPGIASFNMENKAEFYYFALVIITVSIWTMWFVTRTSFGSIMEAVRDNAERVNYLGFRVPATKTVIFVISGFFAGLAGSLFALWLNVVGPASCLHLVNISILTFLAILVGGIGTFIGPFLGVGILQVFNELVLAYGRPAELTIWFLTVLYLLYAPKYSPDGIMGFYAKISRFRLRGKEANRCLRRIDARGVESV